VLHRLGGDGYTVHSTFDRSSTLKSPAFSQLGVDLEEVFAEL
jgi:hypothetical protein